VITQYRIIESSGNRAFDDSVLRAIAGSSPVPVPPTDLYEDFKVVRITFNSLE
jgi:TonB family protein